ncbi:MAG: HU family DNA-binding protein [Nitrospinota bacterium]
MNKGDLIVAMADAGGISKAAAERALDCFISKVTDSISGGENVTLAGFGTFSVATRAGRKGRNPLTGESIEIPTKRVPKFKPGRELKNSVLSTKAAASGPVTSGTITGGAASGPIAT